MTGAGARTAILIDPDVRRAGIDPDTLVTALGGQGVGRSVLVPGLARHPELLTAAVKASRAGRAVVVTAELEVPPIAEVRTWGAAGGLAPLGVQAVALDILGARRTTAERAAYAVRMVRAAVAALDAPGTSKAARRPVGSSLSRRALFSGRATTWVPVVDVDTLTCLGSMRCSRCVEECPEDALHIGDGDLSSAPPMVDPGACGACSQCLDVCPTGALSLDGHDPRTLAKRLAALLLGGDGAAAPALVIACQSALEPLHRLGQRSGLPGWLVLDVPCLGGVGATWHLAALACGARAVQVLPCERCRDQGSLTREIRFTRDLLVALGDVDAALRVGVLPASGSQLRRAVLAANDLTALVDGTVASSMPTPDAAQASPRLAAWAVGELQRAVGELARTAGGPERDQQPRPRVILGEGAPLGILRAAEGCTACGVCARTCPTAALSLRSGAGSTDLVLDPGACTGCGLCVQTCPEGVLDVVPGVDLDLLAGGCVPIAGVDVRVCPDCGDSIPALPAATHLTSLPTELASRCPACRQATLVASA